MRIPGGELRMMLRRSDTALKLGMNWIVHGADCIAGVEFTGAAVCWDPSTCIEILVDIRSHNSPVVIFE